MFWGSKKFKEKILPHSFPAQFKIQGEIWVYFFQALQFLQKYYEKKSALILYKLNLIGFCWNLITFVIDFIF